MATDYTEQELVAKEKQLDLLGSALDGELTLQATRSSAIDSRAGTLVAAAAILGTVQVTTENSFWWVLALKLVLSLLAALLGLLAVGPRNLWAFDSNLLEEVLFAESPKRALYLIIAEKRWQLDARETGVVRRNNIVKVGYVLIALSLVASFFLSFVPAPAAEETNDIVNVRIVED